MQSNNTITSLNELIGICENILYKSQQMKQELNLSNQDKNLIQFFSDLCFTIQKISNSLHILELQILIFHLIFHILWIIVN